MKKEKKFNEEVDAVNESESLDDKCEDVNVIAQLEEELSKTKNDYFKVLAEMENFKKRTNEERIRERKYASQGLIEKLIGIIDVFDQVYSIKTDDEKVKNFLNGFIMLNNSFKQILEEEGVKEIVSKNQVFDPRYHDAIETDCDINCEDNLVLEELRKGYMFKDRVLRPSMVKVNKVIKEENNE
ncbi:MAG: nucleotide exchange factor GrpE [Bacilli bacterium]